MGVWDKIRGQFIDVIEWAESASRNTIAWKYPRGDGAIKNGAQLIVREGQAAIFLHEGLLGDVFGPGRYQLTTANIPILTTLSNWKYGFNEPFKCDVIFVCTRLFTDLKWGTSNPIMLRDPEFGPIRLRAFGSYCMRVKEPGKFMRQLVGIDPNFQVDEIQDQLRNMAVTNFTDALAEAKIAALDLAARYKEMGAFICEQLQPDFGTWGLELSKFLIENISFPPEVEKALDERSKLGILGGNLAQFQQMKAGEAMGDMAKNPGAGNSMGMVAGMNMGQMMGGMMSGGQHASPPPLPQAAWFAGIAGQQVGPLDANGLKNLMASGQMTRETLVWKEGMAGWAAAGTVPEVASLFAPKPPPLPR